jgi:photolyase PhrII
LQVTAIRDATRNQLFPHFPCKIAIDTEWVSPDDRRKLTMAQSSSELIDMLPPHLDERTRAMNTAEANVEGKFVLYWLHHAMRADENPALDVAVTLANQCRMPLLVYQSIPAKYPYASDRHHMFMLQGARDLQQQFHQRGIPYALHVERRGDDGSHLSELCKSASIVVTEDFPVQPLSRWTEQLATSIGAPLLCVDTACVAPMKLVGRAYLRAFQFRKATQALYAQRLQSHWDDAQLDDECRRPELLDKLPWQPLVLADHDLTALVGECDIDHCVAPVPHTTGGSMAGYARWNAFREHGLSRYARRRNDPLLTDGTSRLSPYLHYGMVSPLRVAREAAQSSDAGADKYLDELLIWRELAHAFCHYRQDHETLAALPDWARQTLQEHESDRRPKLYSWETLARGRTGDTIWDAAQHSLLIHGELHNNVRMTWGKALLNWTANAAEALALMIDLNHRYALDGRDPSSYGGILWCLGQFDRPFEPPRPIFGTVRHRSTEQHAQRLDAERYRRQTTRPLRDPAPRVAVIGAGLSGLIAARTLTDHGLNVQVIEKSRGAGGRMATRRTDEGPQFDHGAQYFTVRDDRFQRYVQSWIAEGIVAPWEGRIATLSGGTVEMKEKTTPRFVGVPKMNAVCRHLARDVEIQFRTQIDSIQREGNAWYLRTDDDQSVGEFDYVITSAPAPQSAKLLSSVAALRESAEGTPMIGCWAAMVAFDPSLDLPFDGAFVQESLLSWIARNSTKPGRTSEPETWVLHASPEWSDEHIDADPEEVLPELLRAFAEATGRQLDRPSFASCHRWRYANVQEPLNQRCLFDPESGVGACGDWCGGPRVEGAFLSGMAVAGRLLTHVVASSERS